MPNFAFSRQSLLNICIAAHPTGHAGLYAGRYNQTGPNALTGCEQPAAVQGATQCFAEPGQALRAAQDAVAHGGPVPEQIATCTKYPAENTAYPRKWRIVTPGGPAAGYNNCRTHVPVAVPVAVPRPQRRRPNNPPHNPEPPRGCASGTRKLSHK